ncbi:MAG: hypothetical protein ABUL62_02445 [Myxococcales bacterium]
MSEQKPSLDQLIAAHRAAGGMTEAQRTRNRARLLSGALSGAAASAASVSAASALGGWAPPGALGLAAKVALCVVLIGGAGAAYFKTRVVEVPPATATSKPSARVAHPSALPSPIESTEATSVEAPSSASPLAGPVKAHPARSAAASSASLAAEVALMHDVDAALRAGHPESALALLDARRGNDAGFMAEERAVAHIVTLCQLGRVDQARDEATRFLTDRSRSPLATRVRATCAKPTASGQRD